MDLKHTLSASQNKTRWHSNLRLHYFPDKHDPGNTFKMDFQKEKGIFAYIIEVLYLLCQGGYDFGLFVRPSAGLQKNYRPNFWIILFFSKYLKTKRLSGPTSLASKVHGGSKAV